MEEAHAVMCERGRWVCNEKRLIEGAGLSGIHPLFAEIPLEREPLVQWVESVSERLGVSSDEVTPWKRPAR